MNKLKRFATVTVAAVILTTAGAAFASEFKRPVEIVSELTDQTIESLRNRRLQGDVYGDIAEEYGKRAEFSDQMLEQKKAILDKKVANGVLSQEEADSIYELICTGEKDILFGKEFFGAFGKGLHMSEDGEGKMDNMKTNQAQEEKSTMKMTQRRSNTNMSENAPEKRANMHGRNSE